MSVSDEVQPVAVFAISPDANEDHWAQATWHAELAAREAATEACFTVGDMTRSFEEQNVIISTCERPTTRSMGSSLTRRSRPSRTESG
jgi:hypothetical protein